MQLDVKDFAVANSIDFNFEQLKGEVATKMTEYNGLVYTDEQVSEAKKDVANLRKFVTALDNKRKEIKARCLEPYNSFESKINEIKALVEEPIALIDKQVKDFDEQKKSAKSEAIQEMYMLLEHRPEDGDFLFKIFNPKWLNASTTMSSIKNEIEDRIEKYWNGYETVSKLKEFGFEAMEEYNKTLDIGRALEKQMELKEQAERKKSAKAKEESETDIFGVPQRQWIGFEANMTVKEAEMLKEWFTEHGIEIRRPEK